MLELHLRPGPRDQLELRYPLPHLNPICELVAREVGDVEGRKLLAGDDCVESRPVDLHRGRKHPVLRQLILDLVAVELPASPVTQFLGAGLSSKSDALAEGVSQAGRAVEGAVLNLGE